MTIPSFSRRTLRIAAIAILGIASAAAVTRRVLASDHQDTPEVELNPRMDLDDVFAFPGSSADRIVLVMDTSSPIAGQNASFDPNLLYQFKIDNTGDAVEDQVIQVTFDGGTGANQKFTVRGPVAPASTGTRNTLLSTGQTVTGNVGSVVGSAPGIQVFTGLRADPFVIDLEQFFAIIPDRRPSLGPLSTPSTPTATAFRNPGVDFLRPFNALVIVIELPKSMLLASTDPTAKIGVWGTISR
ncbi:MAG TPA: DUF4331 family protein [Gemmatimonadaceae bacterium]|nr:DUF4331 family protein [Gemmatimonadaceae bacterium]